MKTSRPPRKPDAQDQRPIVRPPSPADQERVREEFIQRSVREAVLRHDPFKR
jgi:hypothetical protein